MDVIDQSLDNWLSPLQAAFPGMDSIAKLALNHRVDRFSLPALPKQAMQTRLRSQIGLLLPLRLKQVATRRTGGMRSSPRTV